MYTSLCPNGRKEMIGQIITKIQRYIRIIGLHQIALRTINYTEQETNINHPDNDTYSGTSNLKILQEMLAKIKFQPRAISILG
jgi:hypothetical protein